jgi:hypothetical protein
VIVFVTSAVLVVHARAVATFEKNVLLDQALTTDPGIVYSTYLGGQFGDEGAVGIGADPNGNVLVAGNTFSPDFPTTDGSVVGMASHTVLYYNYWLGSTNEGLTGEQWCREVVEV